MTKPSRNGPGRRPAAGTLPLQSMLNRGAQFTQERRKHKHREIEKAKVQHAVRTKQYLKLKQQLEQSGAEKPRTVDKNETGSYGNHGPRDEKKDVTHADAPTNRNQDQNQDQGQDTAPFRRKKRLPMQAEIEIGEQVRKKKEEELVKKREERDRIRNEMEAKMKQRKKNSKQARKVTKKGQPVMETRIEALLEKIQKG